MNLQSPITDSRVLRSAARSRPRDAAQILPVVPSTRPMPGAVMPCEAMRSHAVDRSLRQPFSRTVALIATLFLGACMPDSSANKSDVELTVYGFSVMKEPLEKHIFPDFAARWKREHGVDVRFTSSFAGSETITNQ